jgi:elongation factor G
MHVDISAPSEYIGDLMGDLNSRCGRVEGVDAEGDVQTVKARVPLAEMLTYGSTLRSITQGRGSFQQKFSHYDEMPAHLAKAIIEEFQKQHEAAG